MKKLALTCSIVLVAITLVGCDTFSGKEIGTATGVVAGGVAGTALSAGNPAATIGGSLVGGYVGYRAGNTYDQKNPKNRNP